MEKADKISLTGYDILVLHVGRLVHGRGWAYRQFFWLPSLVNSKTLDGDAVNAEYLPHFPKSLKRYIHNELYSAA
jgi:hypothetical protein